MKQNVQIHESIGTGFLRNIYQIQVEIAGKGHENDKNAAFLLAFPAGQCIYLHDIKGQCRGALVENAPLLP